MRVLGASWGRLKGVLEGLGAVLARLGAVLGRLGAVLGRLGAVLGPSGPVFYGDFWGYSCVWLSGREGPKERQNHIVP